MIKMNKEPEILLKGYTVHQVDHGILGKYYLAHIQTISALIEYAQSGNINAAYRRLEFAQQWINEVKDKFPDISHKAADLAEKLEEAKTALSLLEKKLETKGVDE